MIGANSSQPSLANSIKQAKEEPYLVLTCNNIRVHNGRISNIVTRLRDMGDRAFGQEPTTGQAGEPKTPPSSAASAIDMESARMSELLDDAERLVSRLEALV